MCGRRLLKAAFDYLWFESQVTKAAFDSRWSQIWFESKISQIWSTFDARHRRSQSCLISIWRASKVGSKWFIHLNSLLIRVKCICKGVTYLMRIKCVVKNVIIFDLIFDTDQKKSKSNFSCGGNQTGWKIIKPKTFWTTTYTQRLSHEREKHVKINKEATSYKDERGSAKKK